MSVAPKFVLAPVEPTEKMKLQGGRALRAAANISREFAALSCYQHMIEASPAAASPIPTNELEEADVIADEAKLEIAPLEPLDSGVKLHNTRDQHVWADEFCRVAAIKGFDPNNPDDADWLATWIANAMMKGDDDASRGAKELQTQVDALYAERDQSAARIAKLEGVLREARLGFNAVQQECEDVPFDILTTLREFCDEQIEFIDDALASPPAGREP